MFSKKERNLYIRAATDWYILNKKFLFYEEPVYIASSNHEIKSEKVKLCIKSYIFLQRIERGFKNYGQQSLHPTEWIMEKDVDNLERFKSGLMSYSGYSCYLVDNFFGYLMSIADFDHI